MVINVISTAELGILIIGYKVPDSRPQPVSNACRKWKLDL